MFHVVLFEPEIPQNTGNVIRLCANTGVRLHLIQPLGFVLDDARLRRAGLDYHEYADVAVHEDFSAFHASIQPLRTFFFTTKAVRSYTEVSYAEGDAFVFGPESRGLPTVLVTQQPPERRLRVPMRPGSRSLNLSNTVAVIVYEAWRQNGFAGGA